MIVADQVPDGWVVKRLSEVAHITAGGDVDPLTGSPVETDFHPHPVYANAIERSAIHSYSSVARNPAGAVTITARGTLGYAVYREKQFTAIGRLLVVWPNERFDGRFLAQYLNARVSFAVESTGVPQLTGPQAGSYEVMLPANLPEQQAIAAALSDADGVVAGLERVIAKKRLIKQGAMQDLLTARRRLPGFSGEWEVKRLGSVLKMQVGFPFSSAFFSPRETGPRLVRNRDLKSDDDLIFYSGAFSDQFLLSDGDILIGMDGDFSPTIWSGGTALLNQRVGRLKALAKIDLRFCYYVLQDELKKIESVTSGTTVKHLSHYDIEKIAVHMPDFDEQQAIAAVLSDMDAEIQTLESRLAKARAVKEGMMQNLLTGRVRLV